MNDIRLILIKHGRVMSPIILGLAILCFVRLFSDQLIVRQIHGIGVMLLSVALSVYAMDYILRLIGLADDRLQLLSPKPRFTVAILNCLVLAAFLLSSYILILIPNIKFTSNALAEQTILALGYTISIFNGFGLILFVVYSLKRVMRSSFLRFSAWAIFISIVFIIGAANVAMIVNISDYKHWLLGVADSTESVNVFASIIPITVLGVHDIPSFSFLYSVVNLLLGSFFWTGAAILNRRPNNFIEL